MLSRRAYIPHYQVMSNVGSKFVCLPTKTKTLCPRHVLEEKHYKIVVVVDVTFETNLYIRNRSTIHI